MKKQAIIIAFSLLMFACDNQPKFKETPLDSLKISVKASQMADSMVKKASSDLETDLYKKSMATCPVKITKAYIETGDYGSKSLMVAVRNKSGKTVDGVKVSWTLYNNFGDEVDNLHQNGISQDRLSPNKFDLYSWDLYATTATKVKAYIFMIHYTDGSKWELNPSNYNF